MLTAPLAALVVSCALLGASPQRPVTQDIRTLIQRAETEKSAGSAETATRLLRQAEKRLSLETEEKTRNDLAKAIASLVKKVDPRQKNYDVAFRTSAQALMRQSKVYQRRNWKELAQRLTEEAAALWPAGIKGVPTRIEDASADDSSDGDLLPRFRVRHPHNWTLGKKLIECPAPKSGQSEFVVSTLSNRTDALVTVEVKRPDQFGQAGMIVGLKGNDYFILDVQYHRGTECGAYLYYWEAPSTMTKLHDVRFDLTRKERSDWVRIGVRNQDNKATIYVQGKELFTHTCDRPVRGQVGLYVSGATAYDGKVLYRDLRIETPKPSQESLEKAREKRVLDRIAEAERLLGKSTPESATLALLDVARTTRNLPPGKVKETATQSIEKLLKRADPQHASYTRIRRAAASKLIRLAKVYAEDRWFTMAAFILQDAEFLAPKRAEVARAAIKKQRRDAADAKPFPDEVPKNLDGLGASSKGSLAVEPQGAARNFDFLLWFEGGDQPLKKDPWKVSTDGITSPARSTGRTTLLSTGELGKLPTFSLQAKAGSKSSVAAVVFGWKDGQPHYEFSWYHNDATGLTTVALYRVTDGLRKRLGETLTTRFDKAAWTAFMTIRIACAAQGVRIKIGTAPEFTIPVPNGDFAGKMGLHTNVLVNLQPVQFRNLRIEKE